MRLWSHSRSTSLTSPVELHCPSNVTNSSARLAADRFLSLLRYPGLGVRSLSDSSPSPNPISRDFVSFACGISTCDGLADGKIGLTVDTSSSSSEEKSSLAVLKEPFREERYPDEGFLSVIGG